MARKPRNALSCSKLFFARLDAKAGLLGVPKSAIVEIVVAKAIGIPFADLDEDVRQWVPAIYPEHAAE